MHETQPDNQWGKGDESNEDLEVRYQELKDRVNELVNHQNRETTAEELAPVLISGPSEVDLVTVALLMRLYDLQLAILAELNDDRAKEIYEAHEQGGHLNPQVFIPKIDDEPLQPE